MDSLAVIVLLAQDEPQSFVRFLVPLLTVVAIAVFGWLSEKAKKKEQQRQAEEQARRQRESPAPTRQAKPVGESYGRPVQPPAHPAQRHPQRRGGTAEGIGRYQPEIPGGPEQGREWRGAQAAEPELIIVAEDVSAELDRRQLHEQRQRQLHAEAQRRQRAALQARQAAEKAAKKKRMRELHDGEVAVVGGISQPAAILLPQMAETSPAQLRRAIVWAEVLGPPRALRPQQQLF